MAVMLPSATEHVSHQKLEVARRDSSLKPSEEARPSWHLDLGLLAS